MLAEAFRETQGRIPALDFGSSRGRVEISERLRARLGRVRAPILERLPHGARVSGREVAADGLAVADARDGHPVARDALGDVQSRRLALGVRVRGENELVDSAALDPLDERLDAQRFGPYTVQWRDRPAEHVVAAAEAARALDRREIGGALDDTGHARGARFVAADLARRARGQVEALCAQPAGRAQAHDRLAELRRDDVGRGQQEVRQPRGRLLADSRQAAQRLYQALDRLQALLAHAPPPPGADGSATPLPLF